MKIKCVDSRVNVNIFASTSVPFILTTVQVPNSALTHKKRIAVLAALALIIDEGRGLWECLSSQKVTKNLPE